MVARIESLNIGRARPLDGSIGVSGIDKRPVPGPIQVQAPGPKGVSGSGLVGDVVCDLRHHGGDTQAVYAYAREDLDRWEAELGTQLPSGTFGENLTTRGVDITGAVVGEQWKVGPQLLLQVTDPRIPCRTFAAFLGRRGWIKTFNERALPGTYLRVLTPGAVTAGDTVEIVKRPGHGVTVQMAFWALTTRPELFVRLLEAGGDLSPELRATATRRATGASAARAAANALPSGES